MITILRFKEELAFSKNIIAFGKYYDGYDEKIKAVFDMFKHCLIHNYLDVNLYIKELMILDPSFDDAIKCSAKDFPELNIVIPKSKKKKNSK
jgi:hypothetical protein